MENRVQYFSEFAPKIATVVLFESDSIYHDLKPHFDISGFGFMIPGKNIVIIDGEKTNNIQLLNWVEAHEVSHILLKHSSEYNADEEVEADLGAYILLEKFSYNDSCKMVKDYFQQRHGIEFPNERLDEISKKVSIT